MVSAKLAVALPAVLPAIASALNPSQLSQGPGFVRYPVTQRAGSAIFGKHSKRQEDITLLERQSGSMYTIDITLGTPGQTVPVQFDTGSSELWVNPVCARGNDPKFCSEQPRFTESSTLMDLETEGEVVYGSGYTTFAYVADYVDIGSVRVAQQIFGVAHDTNFMNVGIFGAGPSLQGWKSEYPFVIDSMAEQGLINTRAFAMDLRGFDTDEGAVIFGGFDTKKFKGPLQKLPVVDAKDSPDGGTRWWVRLDGLEVTTAEGDVVSVYEAESEGEGQVVLLDSGYTLSALPTPIFTELLKAFPEAETTVDGLHSVDCLPPGEGGSLSFTFQNTTIEVPLYDFVWHAPGVDFCVLGAYEDDFPVLGDTFLRGAYVVHDWENQNVYLAQSADCGSNIVAIEKGQDGIPVMQGECSTAASEDEEEEAESGLEGSGGLKDILSSVNELAHPTWSPTEPSTPTVEVEDVGAEVVPTNSGVVPTAGGVGSNVGRSEVPADEDEGDCETLIFTQTNSHLTLVPIESESVASTMSDAEEAPCDTLISTQTNVHVTLIPTESDVSIESGDTPCQETITETQTTTITSVSFDPLLTEARTSSSPETTATYTIPRVVTCRGDTPDCPAGETKQITNVITVVPGETKTVPAVVPGCTEGAPPPRGCKSCVQTPPTPATTLSTTYHAPHGVGCNSTATGTDAAPSGSGSEVFSSTTVVYPSSGPSVAGDELGGPEASAPISDAGQVGFTLWVLSGAVGGLMIALAL